MCSISAHAAPCLQEGKHPMQDWLAGTAWNCAQDASTTKAWQAAAVMYSTCGRLYAVGSPPSTENLGKQKVDGDASKLPPFRYVCVVLLPCAKELKGCERHHRQGSGHLAEAPNLLLAGRPKLDGVSGSS